MTLKFITIIPIFGRPPSGASPLSTEVRFARWNNANAEPFNLRKRAQQEIEDEIRRERRFESAQKIADFYEKATATTATEIFKSIGTPSAPSTPSIPGKRSKYSRNPNTGDSHPAFRKIQKTTKISRIQTVDKSRDMANVSVSEDGVSYRINGVPFELKYSYTETPKAKPLAAREPPYSPFGPDSMGRPWTGRAPLPPSKKNLKEFDSFQLPPPNKKGVKPVQAPGPYLAGTGPKYVRSREEVLGEALTEEEVNEMVTSCMKTKRQLNMGRDGLTHNMLDNIHGHWKRRRVCKIKCKGVCTVDMDNVKQQLEEKTGGKIIFSRGGVLFLFRGRNYNYKTRPRYPLMLWKPVTPVYPRLVKRAPEGLTLEEAGLMRKKGRKLIPICKLAKNGVYINLVRDVREAFEACELVRINCQGLNGSDYRKIGAKLKDLVPSVLISFEHEHILMWRGRDWKSSLLNPEDLAEKYKESADATFLSSSLGVQDISASLEPNIIVNSTNLGTLPVGSEDVGQKDNKDISSEGNKTFSAISAIPEVIKTAGDETLSDNADSAGDMLEATANINGSETIFDSKGYAEDHASLAWGSETRLGEIEETKNQSDSPLVGTEIHGDLQQVSEVSLDHSERARSSEACKEGVLLLWKQAVEVGSAVVLEDAPSDADIVYGRAVAFAQSAPPGPVFRLRPRRVVVKQIEKRETEDSEVEEFIPVPEIRVIERKSPRNKTRAMREELIDKVPKGTLRVDELAKLLA